MQGHLLAPIYSHFYGYRSIFEGIAVIVGGLFAMNFGFDLLLGIMAGFALMSAFLSLFIHE